MEPWELFYCASILEEAAAEEYRRAAEVEEEEDVRAALLFISMDSSKHAAIMKAAAAALGAPQSPPPGSVDCGAIMGKAWTSLIDVKGCGARSGGSALEDMLDGLESLEGAAGEEYATAFYSLAMREELRRRGMEMMLRLLEMVAEDERRHDELVRLVRERLRARR